ncbi:LysR family transcriptional regulator [Acidimangrovimonas sediminis]|uniref:LysR family transcriptional regulator n=1 Tax=Acidimangrovimonas sediminis TaxID=2056283 RepID=UPI000C7FBF4C|nr:LysR family transcriptional regulator [Acidimangrovimonas sediminis]
MNFKQLEAFYWLTKLQSFHLVAEQIGLTQPAVSARISGLEDEFGVKLIDRDAAGFRLTQPGEEVADFAARFMDLNEALVSRLKQTRKRRFAIGMVGPAALTWGTTLRARLDETLDTGIVDFHVASNVQLRAQLNAGALDLAFLTNEAGLEPHPGGFAMRYSVGWVARPELVQGLVSAGAPPLNADTLRGLPLVLYPRSSPIYSPVAEVIEETRRRPAARHYGNSLSTLAEMVRLGYGASALPLAVLEADIAEGRLVELPTVTPLAPFEVRCVYLNTARRTISSEILAAAREVAHAWWTAHPRYVDFLG